MNGLRKAITIIECWNTINLTNEIQVCDKKIMFVIPCIHKFESYRTIFFNGQEVHGSEQSCYYCRAP